MNTHETKTDKPILNVYELHYESKHPGNRRKPQNHLQFANVSLCGMTTTIIAETNTNNTLHGIVIADTNQITRATKMRHGGKKRRDREKSGDVCTNVGRNLSFDFRFGIMWPSNRRMYVSCAIYLVHSLFVQHK